jgi:hypothetical protein
MTAKNIVFTLEYGSEWIPKEYYPVPGVKAVPEWYKKMETSFTKDKTDARVVRETQTIKRCMPVLDAITAGYVIKTHTDLYVKYIDGVVNFEWAFDNTDTVSFHPAFQLINYRELDLPHGAPKLRNPWGIKTPKGYSCLFISPTHRPVSGIKILEGIVDTDLYTNAVQFPFLVDDGFSGTIVAGTPIAQVIPFKRDSFRMTFGEAREREENEKVSKLVRTAWINSYRNKFRASKDYL